MSRGKNKFSLFDGPAQDETRAQRLARLMKRARLNQVQLSEKAGCTQAHISALLLGKARLTDKMARKLAEPLATTELYLMYGMVRPPRSADDRGDEFLVALREEVDYAHKVEIVKVIGRLAADASSNIIWEEGEDFGELDIPRDLPCYQIIGHSMAPVLWNKQWVKVDWEVLPKDGDLAAVVLKDGRQFCKRLWIEGETYRLVSLRPTDPRRAEPPEPDLYIPKEDVERIGKVRVHIFY